MPPLFSFLFRVSHRKTLSSLIFRATHIEHGRSEVRAEAVVCVTLQALWEGEGEPALVRPSPQSCAAPSADLLKSVRDFEITLQRYAFISSC